MGVYQVTWLMTWLGQEVRNTFYYETTAGEPDDAEWQDICDEIRGDFVDVGAGSFVDSWAWYGIDRRRVDIAGLLSFREVPTAGTLVGTNGNDSVATQVALLISNKGTTVKPNRARSYMCGMTDTNLVDSLWLAPALADMEELIDLQSDQNAIGTNPLQRVAAQWNNGHTQVVDHNDLSGAPSVGSIVPATQRRRRIGVGI
jgi:hypothetical protein